MHCEMRANIVATIFILYSQPRHMPLKPIIVIKYNNSCNVNLIVTAAMAIWNSTFATEYFCSGMNDR